MTSTSQTDRTGKDAAAAGSGAGSESDDANNDNTQESEKVLGKRRARTPPGAVLESQYNEESLSDADADGEPEYDIEIDPIAVVGSAPKFARLASETEEDLSQRGSPQPGPSTTRGARGIRPIRRRTPRTRAAGKEGSPADLDALPYETPQFICGWVPLHDPGSSPCLNSYLEYAKEKLDTPAVAKAQAAIDKCAGRGQSFACEFCGKVYSRLDAVARHRQQPQGKECNNKYKKLRAAERNRAKETQEVEENMDIEETEDKEED